MRPNKISQGAKRESGFKEIRSRNAETHTHTANKLNSDFENKVGTVWLIRQGSILIPAKKKPLVRI